MDQATGFANGAQFQSDVCGVLEQHGADVTEERSFTFYLYLPEKPAADASALAIREAGLECEVVDATDDTGHWLCYSVGSLVPSSGALETIGALMLTLAETHGGEFDGWQASAGSAVDTESLLQPDYTQMAVSVLSSIQANFAPVHEYAKADPADFGDADLDFYNASQRAFEDLGFVHVADYEDVTLTEQGLRTFTRSMMHPESKAVAAIAYVAAIDEPGIIEIESLLDNGQFIVSTTTEKSIEMADWPKIDTQHLESSLPVQALYRAHLAQVAEIRSRHADAGIVESTSYEAVVAMQTQMSTYKHEYLAANGWVTRDWLVAQAGGDTETADGVFEAIQELLAAEPAPA